MNTYLITRSFTRVQEQEIEAKNEDEAQEIADKNTEDWQEVSNVHLDDWDYTITKE